MLSVMNNHYEHIKMHSVDLPTSLIILISLLLKYMCTSCYLFS